jgi:pilus assembly protein CpaF
MSSAATPASPSDLQTLIHERLLATFDFDAASRLGRDELREECRRRTERILDDLGGRMPADERSQMVRGVLDEVFGLGPLEPLLADAAVSDVLVVAPDKVFVERHGRLEPTVVRFRDPSHLLGVIQRIVRQAGRRVDEGNPMVDARLPDGSRVNAVIPPLAIDGPQLSIRRFPHDRLGLGDLVRLGSLAPATASLLEAGVAGRLNIVFSGGAGAGKTTLLNAVSAAIARHERIITIEDAAELNLAGDHVVRLETREANVEGAGEIGPRELVRNALRMRPDRIIVGECRGREAFDMMQAMNTGHEGSMTTLHANGPRDALHRLESMLSMSGFDLPIRILREYVASAIDLVVHLARLPDGRRVVSEVVEVGTSGDEGVRLVVLHRFRLSGVKEGRAEGHFEATGETPGFTERLRARGVTIDPTLFRPGTLATEATA